MIYEQSIVQQVQIRPLSEIQVRRS